MILGHPVWYTYSHVLPGNSGQTEKWVKEPRNRRRVPGDNLASEPRSRPTDLPPPHPSRLTPSERSFATSPPCGQGNGRQPRGRPPVPAAASSFGRPEYPLHPSTSSPCFRPKTRASNRVGATRVRRHPILSFLLSKRKGVGTTEKTPADNHKTKKRNKRQSCQKPSPPLLSAVSSWLQ